MITALNIDERTAGGLRAAFSLFRRNKICVEHFYCDRAAVKSLTYLHRRGKISWSFIDRYAHPQRANLLTPPDLELPAHLGFRRFSSLELSRRLCENAAVYLVCELSSLCPRVALIDNSAEYTGLCAYLLRYTDSVTAVSADPVPYLEEADRHLAECGAPLTVMKSAENLLSADLIIAPHRIDQPLCCSPNAVILSSCPPAVAPDAPVYYDYSFDLPEKLSAIKPPFLDDRYFASALYTLGGVYELGSSVFTRCGDGRILHTRKSLIGQLRSRIEHR